MPIIIKSKEQQHREDLIRLANFRPIDDDFMRVLLKDDLPLAQEILRIILQKDDLILLSEQPQYDMKRLAGARSLCLDVYATDSKGVKYDIEVQKADSGAAPKRARYHSSAMDIENLKAGQEFEELPVTYTIFITENDVFGGNKEVYRIERINVDMEIPFDDDEHILYVNGAFRGDTQIGRLMHDFMCSSADDMHNERLAEKTRYLKETAKGESGMCKAIEEMREETKKMNSAEIALNMLKKGRYPFDEIAECCNLTVEEVKELAEEYDLLPV